MSDKFGWQKLASNKAAQRTLRDAGYQPNRRTRRFRDLPARAICPHCNRPTLTLMIPLQGKSYNRCVVCREESPT